jgi:hypothetical protein
MKAVRTLRSLTETAVAQLKRGQYFFLAAFSVLFVGVTALRALSKPLWYDELFTYYMSRLPDAGVIWSAVKGGADLNPPLLYFATRTAHAVFGDGPIATRLPAILGFLLMLLCVFRFVANRCGVTLGFAAMFVPALSGAYAFAYEARSYGMVLGFCGLSLVFWQAATGGRARRLSLVGLTLSVAAALLSHCYAVLIVIPLALGELARSYRQKRVDWPVWISLAAACSAVATYIPLVAANHRFALDNVTFRPTVELVATSYWMLFEPLVWALAAAFALMAVARGWGEQTEATERPTGFPMHEMAAAIGLALVPVFAYLVAKLVSHVFMTRYGLTAVIGFSILFAAFALRTAGSRTSAAGALPVLFAAWFAVGSGIWIVDTTRSRVLAAPAPAAAHAYEVPPELIETDLPFVASNGLFFLEADHYGSETLVSRLVYLSDEAAAVHYTGSDVFDRGLPIMRQWFPIRAHVEDYSQFVQQHPRFLVFGGFDHPLGWLQKKLLDDGAELRFMGQYHGPYGENLLLKVTMPARGPALAAARK